jgi:hypothetical protein
MEKSKRAGGSKQLKWSAFNFWLNGKLHKGLGVVKLVAMIILPLRAWSTNFTGLSSKTSWRNWSMVLLVWGLAPFVEIRLLYTAMPYPAEKG